ncbi:phage major capsid protein [Actinomyces procaprae]|uniref:phage major capsid protein n=1 Tax=Actinomyces procaprae TaxID=2560010 RepID=UPI00195BB982|nr:phage major capsid protein [Actinomyces procaprae]
MDKLTMLKDAAAKAAQDAQDIAQKAVDERRDLTDAEQNDYKASMAKAAELLEQAKAVKKDNDLLAEVKAFASELGGVKTEDIDLTGTVSNTLSQRENIGATFVKSDAYQALIKTFGSRIPERAQIQTPPVAVKSLFTGAGDTSAGAFVVPEDSGIIEMLGRRPLTLRDVISRRRTSSDVVEYVRQTAHTNAAAPVPEATTAEAPTADIVAGGYKPEGSWAFERVSTAVKTIAEWVPATNRALADAKQLEDLINAELAADLAETEETQMLSGDGAGENLTGILSTSGIQQQAYDTDIFTSVRRAITKARTVGRVAPNAIMLSPVDVETIDLARENGSTGKFLGAGPFAMGPRTLWGLPILESEAIAEGTGLVGDFTKAVLWDREQTTIAVSNSHADFFIRNLVAILAEERLAFGVTRPAAFVRTAVQA